MKVLLIALVLLSAECTAQQPWSGILDSSRGVDWTHAGTTIPTNRTQCGATITPSGATDITDANHINTALQACASGTYLQLGAGVFHIVNGLTFGNSHNSHGYTTPVNGVTLRGMGPDQTTLMFMNTPLQECGTYGAICIEGSFSGPTNQFYPYTGACEWTAGYNKGDTVLTVANCVGGNLPVVGQEIALDQKNDDIGLSGCTSSGSIATCTIPSGRPANFVLNACVGVGAVGGNTLTNVVAGTLYPAGCTVGATGCYSASGYNATMYTPQRNPAVCNHITGVGASTFSYTLPAGGSNAPAVNCPTTAVDIVSHQTGCFATVDTQGVYTTGVPCVTADGNCYTGALGGGLFLGRTCPDLAMPAVPTCAPGEIVWRSQYMGAVVTAVSGSTVTIDPPLMHNNWRTSQKPGIWWASAQMHDNGVESITLDYSRDGGTQVNAGINVNFCVNCWVRNIRSLRASRAHIMLGNNNIHFTVRDSYFWGTKRAASQSYGIETDYGTRNLNENNICVHVVSCVISGLATGLVNAYNYAVDDGYSTTDFLMSSDVGNHDLTAWNLFEGENAPATTYDNIHGTLTGANTHFRNWYRAQNTPPKTENLTSFEVTSYNRGPNLVGNVLGTTGAVTHYEVFLPPGTANNCHTYVYCGGWTSQNGSPIAGTAVLSDPIPDDPLVKATLFRWGNYDVVTGATRWCRTGSEANCGGNAEIPSQAYTFLPLPLSTPSQTLPISFYLSSEPSWFTTKWGASHWPPIGPDVTGGNESWVPSGMAYKIPAEIVQQNAPLDPVYSKTNSTVTGGTFAPASYDPNALNGGYALLSGTFYFSRSESFLLAGASPAGYNGTFQVYASNGPNADLDPGVSMVASPVGTVHYGGFLVLTSRINSAGETTPSGASGANPASTCPASGNCTIHVTSPCSPCINNGDDPTYGIDGAMHGTHYNVYMGSHWVDSTTNYDTTGKFCKQNSAPIPIGTDYYQTTPVILGSDSACVEPPTTNTATASKIEYIIPGTQYPGSVPPLGQALSVMGTLTSPLVQVFNADTYYGAAPPASGPSIINGHGTTGGQGKIM